MPLTNGQAQYAASRELVEGQQAVNPWKGGYRSPTTRRTLSEAFAECSKGNLAKKQKLTEHDRKTTELKVSLKEDPQKARRREKRCRQRENRKLKRKRVVETQTATVKNGIARPSPFTAEVKEVDFIRSPQKFRVGQEWMTEEKAREEILRKLVQLRDKQTFLAHRNTTSPSVEFTESIRKEISVRTGTNLLEANGNQPTDKPTYTKYKDRRLVFLVQKNSCRLGRKK